MVYTSVWYIIGKLRSFAFSWGVWNCDMLYINITIGILTVNIIIITVTLPITLLIYIISQVHIHHYNDEDFNDIITQWCTPCIRPVLDLWQPNCNITYIKIIMDNLTVINGIFTAKCPYNCLRIQLEDVKTS